MLNMEKLMNEAVEDNTIVINGKEFKVNDEVAEQVYNLVIGKVKKVECTATQTAEEKKSYRVTKSYKYPNVTCKWDVQEMMVGKKKYYRVINGIFTSGRWFQTKNPDIEMRVATNQEANAIANKVLSSVEGICKVTPAGERWIAYGSFSKEEANKIAKKLSETTPNIQSVQIQSYIEEHGELPRKQYFRNNKTGEKWSK